MPAALRICPALVRVHVAPGEAGQVAMGTITPTVADVPGHREVMLSCYIGEVGLVRELLQR